MSERFALLNPQRNSRRAILIGAFMVAISPLMAQSVRIRVTDVTGAAIPRCEASLLGPDGKPQRTERANEMGEVILADLPFGEFKVRVRSPGFLTRRLPVTIGNSDQMTIDARLYVEPFETGDFLEPIPSPLGAQLDPPPEVAKPPRPKRHWWQVFR